MRLRTWLERAAWRRLTALSAGLLLLTSFACAKAPDPLTGCICQSNEALREIAEGTLDECAPGVAEWENLWYRECAPICYGQ